MHEIHLIKQTTFLEQKCTILEILKIINLYISLEDSVGLFFCAFLKPCAVAHLNWKIYEML